MKLSTACLIWDSREELISLHLLVDQAMQTREDQLKADIQVLKKQVGIMQSELSLVKETAKREQENLSQQLREQTTECNKLKQNADRFRLELSFIKGQKEEDKSLR